MGDCIISRGGSKKKEKIIVKTSTYTESIGNVPALDSKYVEKDTGIVVPQGYTLLGIREWLFVNGQGLAINIIRAILVDETSRKIKLCYQYYNTKNTQLSSVILYTSFIFAKDEFIETMEI